MIHRRAFIASSISGLAAASLSDAALAKSLAPFKLYDAHTHVYTSDTARYPLRPDASETAREKVAKRPMTPDIILRDWDENGVEAGCGVQYNTTYFTDDRYLLDVAAANPRFTSIVILAPTDPGTPAALGTMAKENRIAGVRFSGAPEPSGEFTFLTPAAHGAWEAADRLGLVVVLMPTRSDNKAALPLAMKRIGELAERYRRVNIVLDHVGFPEPLADSTFGLSPEHLALRKHRNVYYKYTTYLINQLKAGQVPLDGFVNYAVGNYGAEQFVWGSDVGNTEGNYADFVKVAMDSAASLSLAQRRAMFHDTAAKIFIPGGRPLA